MPNKKLFQQDNVPKTTSGHIKELLARKFRFWNGQVKSPDVNPIEYLWDELNQRVHIKKCSIRQS